MKFTINVPDDDAATIHTLSTLREHVKNGRTMYVGSGSSSGAVKYLTLTIMHRPVAEMIPAQEAAEGGA